MYNIYKYPVPWINDSEKTERRMPISVRKIMKKRIIAVVITIVVLLCGITSFAVDINISNTDQTFDDSYTFSQYVYKEIWGSEFTDSIEDADGNSDKNILAGLSLDQMTITEGNNEIFIKSSEDGAAVCLMGNDVSSEDGYLYIVIKQIYDNGVVIYELNEDNKSTETFLSWKDFASRFTGEGYKYFRYIRSPGGTAVQTETRQQGSEWTPFIMTTVISFLVIICIDIILIAINKKHHNVIGKIYGFITKFGLPVIFVLLPFAAGLFYVWTGAVLTVVLILMISVAMISNGKLVIQKNVVLLASSVIVLFYLLTSFWAVDRSQAWFGFIKFLPVPLFMILLCQLGGDIKGKLIDIIPFSGAAMTLASLIMLLVPSLQTYVTVDGRMSGLFQYPNAFAIFEIISIVIVTFRLNEFRKWISVALIVLNATGLLLSGSRTGYIVLFLAIVIRIFFIKKKSHKVIFLSGLAGIIGVILLLGALLPETPLHRIYEIGLYENTFLGRILYFKDSLGVIATHPAGLGYLGYHYLQGSFQTGPYNVMYIHNEFLQMLLDIGWIPFIVSMFALVRSFIKVKPLMKLITLSILLHSFLEFDLQFVYISVILAMALFEYDEGKQIKIENKYIPVTVLSVILGFSVSLGTADCIKYTKTAENVLKYYPTETGALTETLIAADSSSELKAAADRIISTNRNVAISYSALSNYYGSNGDIENMLLYCRKAIDCERYYQEFYDDYFDKICLVLDSFSDSLSQEEKEKYVMMLQDVVDMTEDINDSTSTIYKRTSDIPPLSVSSDREEKLQYYVKEYNINIVKEE